MVISRRKIFKWVLTISSFSFFSSFKLLSAPRKDEVSLKVDDNNSSQNYGVTDDRASQSPRNHQEGAKNKTITVSDFNSIKTGSHSDATRIKTLGYKAIGVGSAVYIQDRSSGPSSSGNQFKLYDADGKGWILDRNQEINSKMLGLVGYGDDSIDETKCFTDILNYSSLYEVVIHVPEAENDYYLLGQIVVPDNTKIEFSSRAIIKARDDLKQGHDKSSAFEVLFRFQNTLGGTWKCNKAKFFYDKNKYAGEHNHIFMFDGASNITIYDANAYTSAGDGYYIGGRFSTQKHCRNIRLIRPLAYRPRRNCLSVISCDELYVEDYSFLEAGVAGHNSSGPCAGIDIEPEGYTDALNLKFSNGITKSSLRPGTVIALTKLQPQVPVNISFFKPSSYYDSRGFELTRVKDDHKGVVKLINPLVVKSRYSSFHGLNCSASGVLFEIIDPIAVDPSTSADEKYCGEAVYYFNNYNDGSDKNIYPQKIGAVKIINPVIKYVNSNKKPNYCVRCCIVSDSINGVSDVQIDNVTVINPLFKPSDYNRDVFNVSAPQKIKYNPFLNINFQMREAYSKALKDNFNARNIPNGFFSNQGAFKNIVINLNEPNLGREYNVTISSSHSIRVVSDYGLAESRGTEIESLRELESNVVGSTLKLKANNVNGKPTWVVSQIQGKWNVGSDTKK